MALSNAADLSTAVEYFKRIYAKADLRPLTERDTPTLRAIPKVQSGVGEGIVVPLQTQMPVGSASNKAQAVANAYGSRAARWILTTKNYYGAVNLESKSMAASKDSVAAYLSLKKNEVDGLLSYMGMRIEQALWSDGGGAIGRIGTLGGSEATRVFTVDADDIINFHVNQILTFNENPSDAAGNTDNRTDDYRVTAVNDMTNEVTAVQITNGADAVVANDYIFVSGDHGLVDEAAPSDDMLTGIQAYIPSADPGSGSVPATLNNVTRTSRPTMLAGWRGEDAGSIEESAKSLVSKMGRYAKLDGRTTLHLSYANWKKLEAELAGRAYRSESASARFNTPALILQTPRGDVPVVAGPFVPSTAGFLCDLSSARLYHLGGFPHMRTDGGTTGVRLDWADDEDGERLEFRMWPELAITDPSGWGRFPIS